MTARRLELPSEIYSSIKALCAKGDALAATNAFGAAISEYNQAWAIVPEPKNNWNTSTWILAAIADACYLVGYKTSDREALQFAMTCPDAVGNPFLHMRYGQVLFDAGELDAAADELMRAYMGGGIEIFRTENPRYFEFLNSRAELDA